MFVWTWALTTICLSNFSLFLCHALVKYNDNEMVMLHVSCVCLLINVGNQFHLVVALKKTRKYFFSSTVHLENKILFNNVQTNDVEALWIFLYFKQPFENIIYVKEIKTIHV